LRVRVRLLLPVCALLGGELLVPRAQLLAHLAQRERRVLLPDRRALRRGEEHVRVERPLGLAARRTRGLAGLLAAPRPLARLPLAALPAVVVAATLVAAAPSAALLLVGGLGRAAIVRLVVARELVEVPVRLRGRGRVRVRVGVRGRVRVRGKG